MGADGKAEGLNPTDQRVVPDLRARVPHVEWPQLGGFANVPKFVAPRRLADEVHCGRE
jgi:hypothetical protein